VAEADPPDADREPFASVVNVLIVILIGAIVLFYAIIPLLHQLGHLSLHY
jgi:hypothetical protein